MEYIYMNPFTATGNAITSLMASVEGALRVINKTVVLAENEIDALDEAQQIRLDDVKYEREQLKAERAKKREDLDK